MLTDFGNRPELAAGPAAEMWRRTLSQIPTQFGRLVFVAGLRDPAGHYRYRPLIESVGREVTDRTLANSHYTVFAEWIASSLENQKSDLDSYLSGRSLPDSATYRDLVPASAHEVERQLYLTDLETLMVMIRFEPGGDLSIPEA